MTSVKGFGSGTYCGVLDGSLRLIGQAHALKKAAAVSAAEEMAKEGKVLDKVIWKFEDRSIGTEKMKKVNLLKNNKEATGPLPLLTHALAVEEKNAARLTWLEWFSEEKAM